MFPKFKEVLDSAFSYKKSLERENVKQDDVNLLREKILKSKIVPKSLTDKQLLRFLTVYKNDLDKVVKMIETYYSCKASVPQLFQNRDVSSKEIQSSLKNQYFIFLPILKDKQLLIYHSLKSHDPSTYDYDVATKVYFMLLEAYIFHYGPFSEAVLLHDLKGSNLRFLFKPSLSSLKHVVKFVEEALPLNIKEVVVFNTTPAFDLIISIVKPFIKSEIFTNILFCHPNVNLDKFYENHVPKSHLPKEFGGTLGTLDELQQQSIELFMQMRDYFVLEDKQSNFEFDEYIKEHPNEVQHSD